MNQRHCPNCGTARSSVADHELDAPHTCPACGDQLVAADNVIALPSRRQAGGTAIAA